MSCCSGIFIVIANILGAAALGLAIYSVIKLNENSEVSIECDVCRTLTNDWDQCDALCE